VVTKTLSVNPKLDTSRANKTPKLGHITALDGVRGWAVAAILAFHLGVPGSSGLYLSLDFFFVLSGYLITTLLLLDWGRNGTISFGLFWSRRARRLLPAMLIVVTIIVIVEAIFGDPANFGSIRGDSLATIFYASNWYYIWTHSSYFGQAQGLSPLQHTWSLAIEEQFYLIWPIFIWMFMKKFRSLNKLMITTCVMAVLSCLDMFLSFGNGLHLNRAYYSTDTRAQALLVGAFLAMALAKKRVDVTPRSQKYLSLIGILGFIGVGVLCGFAGGPKNWAFEGGFFMTDLAVACCIFSAVTHQGGIINKILSLRPFVFLGTISYGLYLWQVPIILAITEENTHLNIIILGVLRAGLSIGVAALSYYLIERPIRTGRYIKLKKSYFYTPLSILLVTASAVSLGMFQPANTNLLGTPAMANFRVPKIFLNGDPLRVSIFGDSEAFSLGIGLNNVAFDYGINLSDNGILGCGIMATGLVKFQGKITFDGAYKGACSNWPDIYRSDMVKQTPEVTVLLVGRWELLDRSFDNGFTWEHVGQPAFDKILIKELTKAFQILTRNGAYLVALTTPYLNESPQPDGQPWDYDSKSRVDTFNAILRSVASKFGGNVRVADLNKDVDPQGQYKEYINNVEIREPDGIHFTPEGGEYIASWLLPIIDNVGQAEREAEYFSSG
jgi:peptidoglycan/LPS O-acetylase OafA/YrhL